MALTLLDIYATLQSSYDGSSQRGLQLAFVKTVLEDSLLMSYLPVEIEPRGMRSYVKEGVLPAGAFRQLNTGYSGEQKAVYTEDTVTLKPYGSKVTIDRKIMNLDSKFGTNQAAIQIDAHNRGLAADLKKYIITSDITINGFLGLRRLTEIGPASQNLLYNNAANGSPLTSAALIVENFDRLLDAVGNPDVLICNRGILQRINAIILSGASNNVLAQKFRRYVRTTEAGFSFSVGEYDGIPMIPIGVDSQRAEILPFTETQGTSTDCTSIYAVRFGTQGVKLLTDSQLPSINRVPTEFGETIVMDWLVALFVQDVYSIARLRGIRS